MTDSEEGTTTTDNTGTKPKRRAILGAVGTLGGLSVVSRSAVGQDDCPEWDPQERGRTSGLMCGELPKEYHEGEEEPWYESSVTFQNCSNCTRLISVRVTGYIYDSKEEPDESDQTGYQSYHIEGGERVTFWFTGSISNFDMSEHSDMNVAISQRSIQYAQTPQCYRASNDSESANGQDNDCPGENPEETGRAISLMCGELPEEYHEGDDQPWYESSITFHNCSSCTRAISVGVTGGYIHETEEEPHERDLTRGLSDEIEGGERKTFWFTGSIDFLDLSEHSDMNVAISQRSIEHARNSQCYRP